MPSIKKLLRLAALAVFAAVVLAPAASDAVERDPYAFRSLSGSIYLEYEKTDRTESPSSDYESRKFLTALSLDLRAWIMSRRFLTYHAGGAYVYSNEESTTKKDKLRSLAYSLDMSFLPLSPIPLGVYASRVDTDSSLLGKKTDTEYGLRWFGYFATLPQTTVTFNTRTTDGHGLKETVSNYGLGLAKVVGSSYNEFNYTGNVNDNAIAHTTSSSHTFSFVNRTQLPGHTNIYAGLTKSFTTSTDSIRTDRSGMSLSLNSRPSDRFRQYHSYTTYRTKSDDGGEQDTTYYSGSIDNNFSSRLTSHLSLLYNTTDSKGQVSGSRNGSTLTSDNSLRYAVTRELSLTESVRYSEIKNDNPTTVFTQSVGDRRTLNVDTSVRYNRRLSWTALTASYAIGFTDDTAENTVFTTTGSGDKGGGKGISQTVSLSLSDINFNRFVGFSTSVTDRRTRRLTGDLNDEYRSFSLGAFNKLGKTYVQLDANYSASIQKSYLESYNERNESYDAGARTGYFKGGDFGVRISRKKTVNAVDGETLETTRAANAGYTTSLLGGKGSASARYEKTDMDSPQYGKYIQISKEYQLNYSRKLLGGLLDVIGSRHTADTERNNNPTMREKRLYTMTYTRPFLRVMSWFLRMEKGDEKMNDVTSDTREMVNQLSMSLRAWTLSVEHDYKSVKYSAPSDREYRETKLFIRAARSFFNAF